MAPTRFWQGSSPHTRGARGARRPGAFDCGIIPAYAGSTRVRDGGLMAAEDHPRIRGEHTASHGLRGASGGSSPHTRGARPRRTATFSRRRIIPAYAGSTPGSSIITAGWRDHPRIRGEHFGGVGPAFVGGGSSPHTRGAPYYLPNYWDGQGIIPAYAGSTAVAPASGRAVWDHPRIRGEHVFQLITKDPCPGSSPHTRGARELLCADGFRRGIIPAYAGSTPLTDLKSVGGGDHPRIRGEHQLPGLQHLFHQRIIPAYAGSTCEDSWRCPATADHPRIRGEH